MNDIFLNFCVQRQTPVKLSCPTHLRLQLHLQPLQIWLFNDQATLLFTRWFYCPLSTITVATQLIPKSELLEFY